MLYGAQASRRQDAQRNRSAIVRVASEMMASGRAIVPLSQIARRAGVGQATLYRHFPNRYALAAAVITHHMERLEAAVTAGADHPALFRRLLREVLGTQIAMRPLIQLAREFDQVTRDRYQQRVLATLAPSLRRAQEHGYVRTDLVPEDLVLLFTMVDGVAEAAGDAPEARAVTDRSIELVMDGVFRTATPADPQEGS